MCNVNACRPLCSLIETNGLTGFFYNSKAAGERWRTKRERGRASELVCAEPWSVSLHRHLNAPLAAEPFFNNTSNLQSHHPSSISVHPYLTRVRRFLFQRYDRRGLSSLVRFFKIKEKCFEWSLLFCYIQFVLWETLQSILFQITCIRPPTMHIFHSWL